jgi:cytochrome bd-type quinol oxidase subunit 2
VSGGKAQEDAFRTRSGYENADSSTAAEIVATVIKAFIGLLGIIFVVLIVASGYNWMTAGGDEAKITKAKNTISRAVIGLILILAAYSITYFVFSNLDSVVDSSGGGTTGSP